MFTAREFEIINKFFQYLGFHWEYTLYIKTLMTNESNEWDELEEWDEYEMIKKWLND